MSSLRNKEKIIFCTGEEKNLKNIIKELLEPKDYSSTIREAKKEFKNFKEKPFYIQEKAFKEMLKRLNTEYPYVVLIGEPGTGKNTMIETLIKCLMDEKYFKNVKKFFDNKTVNLIENLRDKFNKTKERSFLILPNFEDPYSIKPIVYDSYLKAGEDYFKVLEIKDKLESFYRYFFVGLIDESDIGKLRAVYRKRDLAAKELSENAKKQTETIILETSNGLEKNSNLKNWTDNLLSYIRKSDFLEDLKGHIKEVLFSYLPTIINLKKELREKSPSLKEVLDNRFEKDELKLDGKRYSLVAFKQLVLLFPYNRYLFSPEELFQPKLFDLYGKKVIKIKPDSFDNLIQVEYVDDEDSEENAILHSLINAFKPPYDNILYVEEDFHQFLEELRKKGNFTKSFFMAFLNNSSKIETEKLNIELEKHNSILLATDNQDPFIYLKEGFIKEESGLRSRIKLIEVPVLVKEDEKNVKEFVYFIFKEAEKAGVDVEEDLLNYFINYFKEGDRLLVKFRDIGNFLRELFEDAKSKGFYKINLNFLKNKVREDSSFYFEYTDNCLLDYLSSKEKEIGNVSALAIFKREKAGVYLPIKSSIIYNIDGFKLFEFIDKESGLIDESNLKGFGISKNFVIDYLSNIPKFKEGKIPFKILMSFYNNWGDVGGPSATVAMTASIISALSKEEIYKNRFITGALELDGRVCNIGGLYEKGIVAKRMKDKELEFNKELNKDYLDNFSFIFPLTNYSEIKKDLLLDPYNLNDVNLYGVSRFEEAYLLLTHENPKELNGDEIFKLGKKKLEENLNKIEDYWFKKKKEIFIF